MWAKLFASMYPIISFIFIPYTTIGGEGIMRLCRNCKYKNNHWTPTLKYTNRLRITSWVDFTMSVRPSFVRPSVHVNVVIKLQVAIFKISWWNFAQIILLIQGRNLFKLVRIGPLFHLPPIQRSPPERCFMAVNRSKLILIR